MINKNWNINVLLCEECDRNVVNIQNIFDEIYIDEDGIASFDIVTIMSAVGCDEQKFGLYYFVEKVEKKGQIAFICNSMHTRNENIDESYSSEMHRASVEGATFKTMRMSIQDIYFPGPGDYEIKVYKFDNDEAKEIENDDTKECIKYANIKHLVTTYPFTVCKN